MPNDKPLIPASKQLPELTLKVIVLSILLAIVLAAANIYLALKIGTTISASISASVLAIGILRLFKQSNILECNIIQTAASGGEGVAAAVAFIMPAMLILHVWNTFHYWEIAVITMVGSVLGVLFSVPLRRVMLNMPLLPFPEGTAIGNVLRGSEETGASLKRLIQGGVLGGLITFCQSGLQIFSGIWPLWRFVGNTACGFNLGLTVTPLAAGYIVGMRAGLSLFVGFVVGWLMLLPYLGLSIPHSANVSAYAFAMQVWSMKLRYVGVGIMLIGGLWAVIRLLKPVVKGVQLSLTTLSKVKSGEIEKPKRTERDIPINWVFIGVAVLSVMLLFLSVHFMHESDLLYSNRYLWMVSLLTTVLVLLLGFILATVCAYFTGILGSSNSPISGVLISAVLLFGMVFLFLFDPHIASHRGKVAGLIVLVTAVVATAAAVSNENLQDLKAGKMVGATPWKQQVILILGVVVAAFVVGPVLELLFQAYGIGGVFPHANMNPAQMLAAPQANLIAAIAKGMRTGGLPWGMIFLGAGLAVVVIIIDELLQRRNLSLPVLGFGLGIYLPPEVILPVSIGATLSYFVKKRLLKTSPSPAVAHEREHSTIILNCGLVAGAALMGVILAIPFVLMGSSNALAIVTSNFTLIADILGLLVIASLLYWIWRIGIKNEY